MRGSVKKSWLIFSLCMACISIVCIFLTFSFLSDWKERLPVIVSIALFFVATQQSYTSHQSASAAETSAKAAETSAKAAETSAKIANDNKQQAMYIHLASLWYQIKQLGLESENQNFIRPEFTTLFRQEDLLSTYKQYHVYAWMCWGHAEDCYSNQVYKLQDFLPSLQNYKELHYAWLSTPKNKQMFGQEFVKWVETQLLQPKVEVRDENTLDGRGVFSTEIFDKDHFIGFFGGQVSASPTGMSLQFSAKLHIQPPSGTPFRYLNHSCDANAYFVGRNLYAWRNILPGHEITIDYNCTEQKLTSPFPCRCLTTACVGRIEGYNHLSVEEKKRREEKVPSWLKQTVP